MVERFQLVQKLVCRCRCHCHAVQYLTIVADIVRHCV
jgi:hypothetical protein